MADGYDVKLKIIIVGAPWVGKTSLLSRFIDDTFNDTYKCSVGVDYMLRTMEVDGKRIKLEIWDVAGNQRYPQLIKEHYRGAAGVAVVYDVTDKATFDHVTDKYAEQCREMADEGVSKLLVANKVDLASERQVDSKQAKGLADSLGMQYVETSAKTDKAGVEQAFLTLVREIMARNVDLFAEEASGKEEF